MGNAVRPNPVQSLGVDPEYLVITRQVPVIYFPKSVYQAAGALSIQLQTANAFGLLTYELISGHASIPDLAVSSTGLLTGTIGAAMVPGFARVLVTDQLGYKGIRDLAIGAPVDNYWDDVGFFLAANSAIGATTFTDSSKNAISLAVTGNCVMNAIASSSYGKSIFFDGNTDYITLLTNPLSRVGTYPFTIEGDFRFASIPTSGNFMNIMGCRATSSSNIGMLLYIAGSTTKLHFQWSVNGTTTIGPTPTITVAANTWYRYSISRKSDGWIYAHINGALDWSYNIGAATSIFASTASWRLGTLDTGSWFSGYMHNIRFTLGTGKFTNAAYTPAALGPF